MKYILIAVYDRAVGAYQPIFCVRAIGEGVRNFQDAINDKNNRQLNAHPSDFDLHQVGEFDDQTGHITPLDQPKLLAQGSQMTMQPGGITLKGN